MPTDFILLACGGDRSVASFRAIPSDHLSGWKCLHLLKGYLSSFAVLMIKVVSGGDASRNTDDQSDARTYGGRLRIAAGSRAD
jgi:hypothetical protein